MPVDDGYYWVRRGQGSWAEPVEIRDNWVCFVGDAGTDPAEAVEVLREIHPDRPDLPTVAAIRDALEKAVAGVLPAGPGTILVLQIPGVDWGSGLALAGLDAAIREVKAQHGFAGVIALPLGSSLQSLDAAGLAAIGLQAIPDRADATAPTPLSVPEEEID